MKNKFTKIAMSAVLAILMIVMAIPIASASTFLNEDKTVELSFTCDKEGYTFELYQIATLDSVDSSPYSAKYTSLISEADIDSVIETGVTKDILLAMDNLSIPDSAVSYGSFDSSSTSTKIYTELPQGIYYIKVTGYPAGVRTVTNSVVALPYFNGSDWVYEIEPINLAEKVDEDVPKTEKVITNSTKDNENYTDVSLGDTVDFKINSTVAGSTSMKLTTYAVYDEMSAGLTLDNESFNVYLVDEKENEIEVLSDNDYTLNITSEGDGENTIFNIALTESYLSENGFYDSDVAELVITYSATLNSYAVVGTAGNPNEDVNLVYGNESITDSVPGNTVYVYTFGVEVIKLNEDEENLEGATFALYKTEDDASKQQNAIATGTSDADGIVDFKNSNGDSITLSSGTYYIAETEAPDGYNIYEDIIPVDISVTYNDTFVNDTWIQNAPEDGIVSITVTDAKTVTSIVSGFIQTGGDRLICIVAIVLILSFAIFYRFTRTRKRNQFKPVKVK